MIKKKRNSLRDRKRHHTPIRKRMLIQKKFPTFQAKGKNVNITKNKSIQNEPSVAIQGKTVIVTANDYRTGSPKIGLYRSVDGGKTYTSKILPLPNGFDSGGDGVVAIGANNLVMVTGITFVDVPPEPSFGGTILMFRSTDGGKTFSRQILARGSTNTFNDKPWLAVTPPNVNRFRNHAYVAYTQLSDNDRKTAIFFQSSTNGGVNWSKPKRLTNADFSGRLGTSIAIGPNGEVYVAWIHTNEAGKSVFRFRRSTDGGKTFENFVDVSSVVPIPNEKLPVKSFKFRVPTFAFLAVDTSTGPQRGRVYAVWNDFRNKNSNILVSFSDNGGKTWTSPRKANTSSSSTQNFFPAIAVSSKTGKVNIIYYTNRVKSNLLDVFLAQSKNGGKTFTNSRVTNKSFNPNADFPEFIGDYIGVAVQPNDSIYGVWCDTSPGNEEIFGGN